MSLRPSLSVRHLGSILVSAIAGFAVGCAATPPPETEPEKWEKDLLAFELEDQNAGLSQGGVVFVGSSSIRLWDVAASFPDLPVVRRGFGGCHMRDVADAAMRLVVPHAPQAIVVYAGDNDIAAGKSPEQVLADYDDFVATIREHVPTATIIYISIKPSPDRWRFADRMRRANALVQTRADEDSRRPKGTPGPRLLFIDVWPSMLGPDGTPRRELYVKDGLHLSPEGYGIWRNLLRPIIDEILASSGSAVPRRIGSRVSAL